MNKYNNFKSVDFIEDPEFRAWVLRQGSSVDWELLGAQNLSLGKEMEIARLFLKSIEDKQPTVSDEYIRSFGEGILKKHNSTSRSSTSGYTRSWYSTSFQSLYIAASVMVAFGLGWIYYVNSGKRILQSNNATSWAVSEEKPVIRFNHSQKPLLIILQDGSKVTLQPNSSITYPQTFDAKERNVQLEGEAFFDVTKNPEKPFLVYFNNLTVKVLGTSFNIRSYGKEEAVKVTVKTGKVSVFTNQVDTPSEKRKFPAAAIMLTANQEVLYKKGQGYFEKSVAANTQIIDQTISEQDFIFSETPLSSIFSQLEKAYGISIIFDEEQIQGCSLTASLADEPLLEKLNMICKTMNATYEIVDGQIVMNIKSCRNSIQ